MIKTIHTISILTLLLGVALHGCASEKGSDSYPYDDPEYYDEDGTSNEERPEEPAEPEEEDMSNQGGQNEGNGGAGRGNENRCDQSGGGCGGNGCSEENCVDESFCESDEDCVEPGSGGVGGEDLVIFCDQGVCRSSDNAPDSMAECDALNPLSCEEEEVCFDGHCESLACQQDSDCDKFDNADFAAECLEGIGFCLLTRIFSEDEPMEEAASCRGVSQSCFSFSEVTCRDVSGCRVVEECRGVSRSCSLYGDQFSCGRQNGCSWSNVSDSCQGGRLCFSQYSEFSCESVDGCRWESDCRGVSPSCFSLENENTCAQIPGCRWE